MLLLFYLKMYRVFGCKGSTGNDIIIKALLKAYDDGCDIISLSLGKHFFIYIYIKKKEK